jgi:RNA polymerase sigma factor (sigma-70 family)
MSLPQAPEHADDLRLAKAALAGDKAAGAELADRMTCIGRFLRTRGRRFCPDASEQDLLDIGSEVFVKVWERLPRYEGRAALESWVFAFCEGEVRNEMRRRIKRKAFAHQIPEDALPASPEPEIDHTPVLRCLDRLPADERQLVRDKHFSDLRLEDIAVRNGSNLNTVKSRYYRALLQLRHCLERTRNSAT